MHFLGSPFAISKRDDGARSGFLIAFLGGVLPAQAGDQAPRRCSVGLGAELALARAGTGTSRSLSAPPGERWEENNNVCSFQTSANS